MGNSSEDKACRGDQMSENLKVDVPDSCVHNMEVELQRLAEEELMREAKMAAARAELGGTYGWQKCTLPKTNKKFLRNTILHTLSSNSCAKMKRNKKK